MSRLVCIIVQRVLHCFRNTCRCALYTIDYNMDWKLEIEKMPKEKLEIFVCNLPESTRNNLRSYPWRKTKEPYGILIAERALGEKTLSHHHLNFLLAWPRSRSIAKHQSTMPISPFLSRIPFSLSVFFVPFASITSHSTTSHTCVKYHDSSVLVSRFFSSLVLFSFIAIINCRRPKHN